jgi:tetratricopeptide (TPR) repeat protein
LNAVLHDAERVKPRVRSTRSVFGLDFDAVAVTPRRVVRWGVLPFFILIFAAFAFLGSKQWLVSLSTSKPQKISLADSIDVTTNSSQAYYYFSKGRQLWWRYAAAEAIENLQIAVEIDTSFSYAYCLLGLLLNWVDRSEQAALCFEKSMNNYENLAPWEQMLVRGFQYYSNDEPQLMLEQFVQLVERYPDVIDGYSGAMLACEKLDDYDRAIMYGKRLLKIDSTHIATYNNLADLYKWKNDYQAGLFYSEKQLEIIQQSGDLQGIETAYESIGYFYHLQSNSIKAKENLQKALEYEPENHDASEYLAEVLFLQGEIQQAEQVLKASVSVPMQMQRKAKLYNRLANLYILTGRFEEALETLKKSRTIHFERQSSIALNESLLMYRIYGALEQHRLAENDLISLQEQIRNMEGLQKSNRTKQLELYLALARQDSQLAEKIIRHDLPPRQNRVNPWEIEFLMAKQNTNQALELLSLRIEEDTCRVSGERIPDYLNIAIILNRQNKHQDALDACLSALATRRVLQAYNSVDYIRALALLPEIYENLNEYDKAVEACDRFLGYWENADPGTTLLVRVHNCRQRLLQM